MGCGASHQPPPHGHPAPAPAPSPDPAPPKYGDAEPAKIRRNIHIVNGSGLYLTARQGYAVLHAKTNNDDQLWIHDEAAKTIQNAFYGILTSAGGFLKLQPHKARISRTERWTFDTANQLLVNGSKEYCSANSTSTIAGAMIQVKSITTLPAVIPASDKFQAFAQEKPSEPLGYEQVHIFNKGTLRLLGVNDGSVHVQGKSQPMFTHIWHHHKTNKTLSHPVTGQVLTAQGNKITVVPASDATTRGAAAVSPSQQWTVGADGKLVNGAGQYLGSTAKGVAVLTSAAPSNAAENQWKRSVIPQFRGVPTTSLVNATTGEDETAWIVSGVSNATALCLNVADDGTISLQPQSYDNHQLWKYNTIEKTLLNVQLNKVLANSEVSTGNHLTMLNPPAIGAANAAEQWTFDAAMNINNAMGAFLQVPSNAGPGATVTLTAGTGTAAPGDTWKGDVCPPMPDEWGYNEFNDFSEYGYFLITNAGTGQVIGQGNSFTDVYPLAYGAMQNIDGNPGQLFKFDPTNTYLVNKNGMALTWNSLHGGDQVNLFPVADANLGCCKWGLTEGLVFSLYGYDCPGHHGPQMMNAASNGTITLVPYDPLNDNQEWFVQMYEPAQLSARVPTNVTLRGGPAPRPGISRADVIAAINKYGPIVKFHPREPFQMNSVEWFLARSSLYDSQTNTTIVHPDASQLPQDPSRLPNPHNPDQGRYWFNCEDAAKPGDISTANAYVHAIGGPAGTNYTDIQFWLFYSYNGPGTANIGSWSLFSGWSHEDVGLSPMGEHWGDWEMVMIRIDNATKNLIGVYMSEHGGYAWYNAAQLAAVQRSGTQIVVYSSLNGHAVYAAAGDNPSEHRTYVTVAFQLQNYTADGGNTLNCGQRYIFIDPTPPSIDPPPGTGGNTRAVPLPPWSTWVNYMYRWGPEGQGTNITPATVRQILSAAGLSWALGILGSFIVSIIVPYFATDNKDGPAGPKDHDNEFNGPYNKDGYPPVTGS